MTIDHDKNQNSYWNDLPGEKRMLTN